MRKRLTTIIIGLCVCVSAWLIGGEASAGCRTVEVQRVRMASVELYNLDGVQQQTVSRDHLSGVSEATECTEDQRFLMISLNNQNFLVQRAALALPTTITRPLCPCPALIASAADRRAADPGVGDQICNTNPSCPSAGLTGQTPTSRPTSSPAGQR